MILYISSFIIFVFVSFSLFFRAHCPLALKLAGSACVLVISLKYVVYQIIGGAFFSPSLPRWLVLFFEALYGALILLFFLLILWTIYLCGNWLLAKIGFPVPQNLPKGYIKCGIVLLSLAMGAWGTWQSVKVPDAKTVELRISGLPQPLEGLRIAQLTDLHIGPLLKKDWLEKVVERTNALNPDIVAMTGDYIDGYASEIGDELSPLASLRSRYGIYGVTGNHEYYWNMPEWIKLLKKNNIDMLENEFRALSINGSEFVIAGLPDVAATRFNQPPPDINAALVNAPQAVRLLLCHNPGRFNDYAEYVDAQLSGHTHGGLMFFLRPLVSMFNNGFVFGKYIEKGKNLYVSPGTGLWNGFSCRIGNPAEITLVILRPGNQL